MLPSLQENVSTDFPLIPGQVEMGFRLDSSLHTTMWNLSRRSGNTSTVTIEEIPEGHAMRGLAAIGSQGEVEDGYLKISAEDEDLELIPSLQKKFKNSGSSMDRKRRTTKRLQKMSIRERCLLVEHAIYADDDFEDLIVEYQDMWEFMEEVSEPEKAALLVRKKGKYSQSCDN